MITINPNSKETHLTQIIDQWLEITDLKAQWQRISDNTWLLEDAFQSDWNTSQDYYYDCINALVILSQCPNSEERLDIEEIILIDLMTSIFVNIHPRNNLKGLWEVIRDTCDHIDLDDYPSLPGYCDVLNVLAQCPDSKEKRKLETETGLDILDYIF
tara:strand:+ start:1751 stop:2221 length:471 start_codon:yes stop_codon:yes gene_type:complete